MIELVVKPGPAIHRSEFLATHPPFSIALDGYVFGQPFLVQDDTGRGPYRSFNHHEEVDRSTMCATCEQARRAVLLGLYDLFSDARGRRAVIHVNDCDQDVCLATWILMNPDRAAEPLVRVLSQIEDLLDMSGGTFPMPHDRDLLGEVRWVFEPYVRVRQILPTLTARTMREVIRDVHHRIDQFLVGRAEVLPLEGTFERIGGGRNWIFAEISSLYARERMIQSGVRAAVELYGRAPGDRYLYSLWRRSEYVAGFPVPRLLEALNEAEGYQPVDPRGWGGADNVGGAPRGKGSALPPERVQEIVDTVLQRSAS
jgi:hypothetical protein